MLYDKVPPLKSYEELLKEAVSQIPVYSSQWTNYNESDPGITMLQNFAAFHRLQQESIFEVSEESRLSFFKLLGMEPEKDRCERIVVEAEQIPESEYVLPVHEKLAAGEGFYYETDKHIHLKKNRLFRVYTAWGGEEIQDISQILQKDMPAASYLFGEHAKPGTDLYLCFHSLPSPSGEFTLYVRACNKGGRNPLNLKNVPPFARLRWQCYTAEGWKPMKAWDKTGYFLSDGEIKLKMPAKKAEYLKSGNRSEEFYAIRCCLEESHYDYAPCIFYLSDRTFLAVQRHTKVAGFSKSGMNITVNSGLVREGYFQVFVKEEEGEDFRLYQKAGTENKTGRYYRVIKAEGSRLKIQFDWEAFQYGPKACQDAVRVVCYSEEMVNHRFIGTVYGYENQVLNIEQTEHVLEDSFELIAELKDESGESRFRFIKPFCKEEDSLGYELLPVNGQVRVYNPGFGTECRLYLSHCAVTRGKEGNLRTGAHLHIKTLQEGKTETFISIGTVEEGHSAQTLKEMELQLEKDMSTPSKAVTAEDYEWFVKRVPGLCIDGVSAVTKKENQVEIVVKPKHKERFPQLTKLYQDAILDYLESRRMIGTCITLIQPVYTPIHIKGRIGVRDTGEDCLMIIRGILKEELDYDSSDITFGKTISFHHIYERILSLRFVVLIKDLVPETGAGGYVQGMEIKLDYNSLGYLHGLDLRLERV